MALGLHPQCRSRLKEKLADCLPDFRLNYSSYLDRRSLARLADVDMALPRQRELTASLESYVNETPFFDFVYGELSKELHDSQEFDSDSRVKRLIDIAAYSNAVQVADRLVESFEQLPRVYRFTFGLNRDVSRYLFSRELVLASGIRLVRPDDSFENEFPLQSNVPGRDRWLHGLGLFSFGGPKKWDRESSYLQVEIRGFVGSWVTTTPVEAAIASLKSVIGVSLALRALEVVSSYSPSTLKQRAYVHQKTSNGWEVFDSLELDESLSNAISNLRIDTLNGTLGSEEEKTAFLKNRLALLARAVSDMAANERVLLAGKWLLDSCCGREELLSFVQATVALEILLGDKDISDLIGIGELLRNRCAYLIGKTHGQREEILADFKKIYDIRSTIVHRGKDRLREHERKLFYKLQWMVNRVIQEEIERMQEPTKNA